ncbi:MAG TPA: nucleotide-binding protein [Ramlibacter sp.]|nr:nucleotide-binding protein [Ramlibacter sp.]
MKSLLLICLLVAAPFVWAQDKAAAQPPAAAAVTGEVLEVRDVESYTYLRLKTAQGETWAAVATAPVKKGAKVTIENVTVMNNFQSKALKKTFDKVVFGTLAGAEGSKPRADMASPHAGIAKAPEPVDVRVPKATGANARTVAEIMTKAAELKDKPVLIRGKVVKYSPSIMGRNWIHLRDGSGSAADKTNDLLVTTAEQAKVGDVVTFKGVVRVDKDFGAGYSYKALVEDATLQK